MTGFFFLMYVLLAALIAGFKSRRPAQLPGLGLFLCFTLAAGAYLFI
jgi:hypothetical protein